MSETNDSRQQNEAVFRQYHEIVEELNGLRGKTDAESSSRFDELLDQLMTCDMALGPMRKAMCQGRREETPKNDQNE